MAEGGHLLAGSGIVTKVRVRGEPAGTYVMRNTGDPYFPVEYPVLHCLTSLNVVPSAVIMISKSLKGNSSGRGRSSFDEATEDIVCAA